MMFIMRNHGYQPVDYQIKTMSLLLKTVGHLLASG